MKRKHQVEMFILVLILVILGKCLDLAGSSEPAVRRQPSQYLPGVLEATQ